MKNLLITTFTFLSMIATAGPNNTNYAGVTEIKVWPTYIDIYSESENVCNNESSPGNKFRYILNKDEKEMYSLLLAAMTSKMKANMNYTCTAANLANIDGIRVKP